VTVHAARGNASSHSLKTLLVVTIGLRVSWRRVQYQGSMEHAVAAML
jgi:hypothetical protein